MKSAQMSGQTEQGMDTDAMVRELYAKQKADAEDAARQKVVRRSRNRSQRVFDAKLLLGLALGGGGAALGGMAGRSMSSSPYAGSFGALGGAVLGGLGGVALGGRVGNSRADTDEAIEDATGTSVDATRTEDSARAARNLALLGLFRR